MGWGGKGKVRQEGMGREGKGGIMNEYQPLSLPRHAYHNTSWVCLSRAKRARQRCHVWVRVRIQACVRGKGGGGGGGIREGKCMWGKA